MARPKPDPESVIPHIRAQAIELLKEQGFEQLTMRALAKCSGMSVGKLYRFFPSKDALFLSLEIEYFDALYDCLKNSLSGVHDAKSAFRKLLHAYYDFATEHFALYKLVTAPPKVYTHYVGTGHEALARDELESALAVVGLVREKYEAMVGRSISNSVLQQGFLLAVNCMHGIIMMSQSSAWPYISQPVHKGSSIVLAKNDVRKDVEMQLELLIERLC